MTLETSARAVVAAKTLREQVFVIVKLHIDVLLMCAEFDTLQSCLVFIHVFCGLFTV